MNSLPVECIDSPRAREGLAADDAVEQCGVIQAIRQLSGEQVKEVNWESVDAFGGHYSMRKNGKRMSM